MTNFDLANLALQSAFPNNKLLTDDKGMPSIMVYVPKFKMSDVIEGATDSTHPAFIINGVEKDGIYISKFQNVVYNGRAYSLPGEEPQTSISFDTAISRCTAKGPGWHLMTAMEWGALALWCQKNGWLPYGNNNYGKDARETMYIGVPKASETISSGTTRTTRIGTGTGPVEYSHNKQLNGIYDLNGNVSEWVGGARLVIGELQILENNNAAVADNSQSSTSAQWKAINALTGELMTPAGNGGTTNSLKLDYVDNIWQWSTNTDDYSDTSRSGSVANTTFDTNVCDAAKEIVYALGLAPSDSSFDYQGDIIYANNGNSERLLYRGGNYGNGSNAGVFYSSFYHARSSAFGTLGFRSAYYD